MYGIVDVRIEFVLDAVGEYSIRTILQESIDEGLGFSGYFGVYEEEFLGWWGEVGDFYFTARIDSDCLMEIADEGIKT